MAKRSHDDERSEQAPSKRTRLSGSQNGVNSTTAETSLDPVPSTEVQPLATNSTESRLLPTEPTSEPIDTLDSKSPQQPASKATHSSPSPIAATEHPQHPPAEAQLEPSSTPPDTPDDFNWDHVLKPKSLPNAQPALPTVSSILREPAESIDTMLGCIEILPRSIPLGKESPRDDEPACSNEEKLQLDQLYHSVRRGPTVWDDIVTTSHATSPVEGVHEYRVRAIREFMRKATERSWAGSDMGNLLQPSLPPTLASGICPYRNQQVGLVERQTMAAYLFVSTYVEHQLESCDVIPDFVYRLPIDLCDKAVSLKRNLMRPFLWPALSQEEYIMPFATGEVKVDSWLAAYNQLGMYASYYIILWVMLRARHILAKNGLTFEDLEVGATAGPTQRLKFDDMFKDLYTGVGHYGFYQSPCLLQIFEYKPDASMGEQLRITSRLICSGDPCNERFMEKEYIPWCRLVMSKAIANQMLYLIPAINSYFTQPPPAVWNTATNSIISLHLGNLCPNAGLYKNVTLNPAANQKLADRLQTRVQEFVSRKRAKRRPGSRSQSTSQTGDSEESCLSGYPLGRKRSRQASGHGLSSPLSQEMTVEDEERL